MAKKQLFAAGSFDDLRAASGETTGAPLRLPLTIIDEDPDQPRKRFDQGELQAMAESIRLRGILQPIGVRPAENGRHVLVFGARRLRAAKLAEQADIPAIVVPDVQHDLATQVIENQQRADLSNSDLAAVVNQLFGQGMKLKQIAVICNLPEYLVSCYRAAANLPAFLAGRIDQGDMRAIYELSRAAQKAPAEIEEALNGREDFLSVTEARRIIQHVTGKTTSSVFLRGKEPQEPEAQSAPAPVTVQPRPANETTQVPSQLAAKLVLPEPAEPAPPGTKSIRAPRSTAAAVPSSVPAGAPVFVMETPDGRRGVLVTSKKTGTRGLVLLEVDGNEIEAMFAELRPMDAA